MTKKKKSDMTFDIDGDDVAIDFGPIKIRGNKGPTAEERRLRAQIQNLHIQMERIKISKNSLRETAIRQQERLNAYRQIIGILMPKLDNAKEVPDEQKKEAIEKIQKWIKDVTKDDNLEG